VDWAVRLLDLDPRWLIFEGRRVGFIFRCPLADRRKWWQTCFVEPFYTFKGQNGQYRHDDEGHTPDSQAGIVARSCPEAKDWFQPCDRNCCWTVAGGIEAATFDTLSVAPSIDGSAGGNWHGYITDGQIVGGI